VLLDSLNACGGQTLQELCSGLDMARQSVSKHLAVLEAANLVTTVRRGWEKLHYLNAEPINAVAERWIDRFHGERVHALADLKRALEETPMTEPEFVYTTYIRTTPGALLGHDVRDGLSRRLADYAGVRRRRGLQRRVLPPRLRRAAVEGHLRDRAGRVTPR
jgi:DNA-binding transcriptional ArsR family regulator